jgi:hypothetical protein
VSAAVFRARIANKPGISKLPEPFEANNSHCEIQGLSEELAAVSGEAICYYTVVRIRRRLKTRGTLSLARIAIPDHIDRDTKLSQPQWLGK